MLYRTLAILIVGFWLVMTGLLVRTELVPDATRLREVPMFHVVKLLFLHEQPSDLQVFSDNLRVGDLRIHPRTDPDTQQRRIEFSGNLQLHFPAPTRQRFAWDGAFELDRLGKLQLFRFGLSTQESTKARMDLLINPLSRRALFTMQQRGGIREEQEYTLDENGANEVFAQLGIDPAIVKSVHGRAAALAPTLSARQSTLRIHGERVETYLISVTQNEHVLADIHVSQLGQVLKVKTAFGYTLVPQDVVP